jgi:hypothetical protein
VELQDGVIFANEAKTQQITVAFPVAAPSTAQPDTANYQRRRISSNHHSTIATYG